MTPAQSCISCARIAVSTAGRAWSFLTFGFVKFLDPFFGYQTHSSSLLSHPLIR